MYVTFSFNPSELFIGRISHSFVRCNINVTYSLISNRGIWTTHRTWGKLRIRHSVVIMGMKENRESSFDGKNNLELI